MDSKILFIVNPNAGKGKGLSLWENISNIIREKQFDFSYEMTEGKGDAEKLAKKYIEQGYRKIISVSGDGMLNEVANGIIKQDICPSDEISLGMIPMGTGNDWARTFCIPDDFEGAVSAIERDKTMVQDAGAATFYDNGKETTRYFLNAAGIGYDALVAKRVDEDKEKNRTGSFLYMKNLMSCLIRYKYYDMVISFDRKAESMEFFSMSIGIGKYIGGGMLMMPNAIPDNGLFDITLIKKISKVDVIKNVKNLYDGSFVKHPKIEQLSAKEIIVDTKYPIGLEVDGEVQGDPPYKFNIMPEKLNAISGSFF